MSSGNRGGGDRGSRGRGGGRGGRGTYGGWGGRGTFRGDTGSSRGQAGDGRGGYGRQTGGGQQTIQIFPNSQGLNSQVANVEDTLHPATKSKLDLNSLALTEGFPSRPGYGTRGTKVELTANYVELLPPSNLTLHRYDIQISPAAAGKKHFRVVQLLLQAPEFAAQQGDMATDFRSALVSKTKFSQDEVLVEVPYRSEGEDEPTARATVYKVRVQYTKTLDVGELVNYLNSTSLNQSLVDKQELTQALNIFLNHYAKSAKNLVTIGSTKSFSLSSEAARGDIGSGLEIIRGFFSSVRVATCRILVNINVSHGAFYQAVPLPALMKGYGLHSTVMLERFLKLVRIQTTHLPEKRNKANEVIPRVKTIFGLARKDDGHGLAHPPRVRQHGAGAKDVEFWLDGEASSTGVPKPVAKGGAKGKGKGKGKAQAESSAASTSGKYITVFDFFRITYNLVLQNPQLPLVNCGNRGNPMYLPAEVCIVLPGQPSKSKLSVNQAQQMIRHAVRKPWENANSIYNEGLKTVGLDENTNILLRSFGLKIAPGLIKVPGRILFGPKVIYKNNKAADLRFGSWNMLDIRFNIGASLAKWSYLVISIPGMHDSFDQQSSRAVMNEFHTALQKIGVNAAQPFPGQRLQLQHQDDPALGPTLERAARALDLLFIILPGANMPIYKRIKTMADKSYGIHTICSVGSKLAKDRGRDQYMNNVALKFNLKLGGINQRVENKNLGIIDQDKTMVVGIDVTHPSPGSSSNAPSVSAMVSSIDKFLGQWPATLRIQRARQENVDDLTEMLKSRLGLWKTKGKHATFPENILIYRDGVSEGQYDMVLSQELPQLRRACEQMYPAADTKKGLPRFTIIVCGKRHKTRFYPTTEKDCDRSGNTKPGTVVDRGVTEARNWDFFLQAHAALQGTARPCHYYIVHDEIFRQIYAKSIPPPFQTIADIVEDLTHNMCYLFGRATKAVSLCPPAYYADIACERARCYLASLFDTPSPSAAPSVTGTSAAGGTGQLGPDDVQIHQKLRDTMFYI
ncbi:putative argonaute like post-transcriptional gene silencing protein QDE-2 [Fusarium proliferatum ET1]|uniref:Probable argonaute like post-transcriptional gene silencing protein QDE-2 n=1 Tax=Fusarium proliferatum (strain ET1) TaxID=1227346 RepID=A0A1L7VQN9_FUSPR|nr:putative argonaute like post-transcriptional gene silencing protein QDE-2 [Fusarium proliferatum ET1]CZR42761.1 probable argonaute like post-transcriptional gene silencing protein QDE-2 [Fusarium proliferatum ET1]